MIEKLGLRTAYDRLAGNKKELEEDLQEIRKLAEKPRPNKENDGGQFYFLLAKALFLNEQPQSALEVLGKSDRHLPTIFEILAAQQKYREALALVEKAKAAVANAGDEPTRKATRANLAQLECLQARTLFSLGEKEQARPIFARLAGEIKQPAAQQDSSWFDSLIEAEFRAGLTDEAFDHALTILTVLNERHWPGRLFGKLFPGRGPTAEALWSALKALFPLDSASDNLKRLRDLLAGKLPRMELARWIDNAEGPLKNLPPEDAENWRLALAEAALAGKQEELARGCLEKGSGPKTLLKLGDLLAGKKEWEQAARRYYQAWEKDREQALPLYLSGKALVQAGQLKEGKQRMEQASWLPLGNEAVRWEFCEGLAKRGDSAALRRQIDLLMRLGQPGSYYVGNTLRRIAGESLQRKDWLKAADYQERATLRVLHSDTSFLLSWGYIGVPTMIERQRGRGLLSAGKVNEALLRIAICQEMLPGNVDLAIQVVPELEKLGKKKEAEEQFMRVVQVYEKLCKEYPRCPWTHNSIAWTSACCRRNLDSALEHAQKAVELAPKNAGHLDTLSEVYFQRGDKARAIELEKKVIELEPNRPYFRKQLRRLEAGDPKAPLPPEGEDEEDDS